MRPEMRAIVEEEARRLGVTAADVVRYALDSHFAAKAPLPLDAVREIAYLP